MWGRSLRLMQLGRNMEGPSAGQKLINAGVDPKTASLEDKRVLVEHGFVSWLWERAEDEVGQPFWYNSETGEATWDEPSPEDMQQVTEVEEEAPEPEVLPDEFDEWELCEDDNGHRFYFNIKSGASQWDTPRALKTDDPVASAVANALLAAKAAGSFEGGQEEEEEEESAEGGPGDGQLMLTQGSTFDEEWEECVDDQGQTFFYNTREGVSTWEDPRVGAGGGAGPDPHADAAVGDEWEEVEGEDGVVYYYNHTTGESTYDPPGQPHDPGAAPQTAVELPTTTWAEEGDAHDGGGGALTDGWELLHDEDGTPYYYNNHTGESSWTVPE